MRDCDTILHLCTKHMANMRLYILCINDVCYYNFEEAHIQHERACLPDHFDMDFIEIGSKIRLLKPKNTICTQCSNNFCWDTLYELCFGAVNV